jgi:anti-sigma regulatory factor (Ser/Thr protein kinase)
MGPGDENGHRDGGPAAVSTTVLARRRRGDPAAADDPNRCQGRSIDGFGRRVRPCPRAATIRVTGTHRLTADLCWQHARVAVDRPRLVRDWLLQELTAGGAPVPGPAAPAAPAVAGSDLRHDLTLRVAAQLASIAEVRGALSAAFRSGGWPDELMPLVVLAVGEAVANAIEHGSGPGGAIEVAVTVRPEWAAVRVVDEGRVGAAVPLVVPVRPSATDTRGRGLLLMLDVAERVEVDAAGSGTSVLLRFARGERAALRRPGSAIPRPG